MISFHLTVSSVFVFLLVIVSVLVWRRFRMHRPQYTPLQTGFAADIEHGMTSSTFDLHRNLVEGDPREGLDDAAVTKIRGIMKQKQVSFDQARVEYIKEIMRGNNIDASGMPLDAKAVTRL
ncbi:fungal protein [Schizosaccharomyces japonicus yFS275]|uniref:Fungal protein n=1 Tax=Schizosaccharomyces japonicus (strain yFS275 / FY16936) TaxID=402676 RepID=B6JWE9_SCHJY|nr:fungal protein [Schizosaccharomyces japonicus yFS275]EEB05700.1 fungal protein [Schizosaccharomyces japonicus yFS275]